MTASPAFAAVTVTWQVSNHGYYYDGDGTGQVFFVTCSGGNVVPPPTAGGEVACADITYIGISPQGGVDTVDLSGVTAVAFPGVLATTIAVDGDFTGDFVTGSPLNDQVFASGGDDVSTAGGNDAIDGAASVDAGDGNDLVTRSDDVVAGPGDDRVVNSLGSNVVDGGPGEDTIELDMSSPFSADVSLVLTATQLSFQVTGGSSDFPVSGFEHGVFALIGGGTQAFDGSAFPGDVEVRGLGGPDTLTGTAKSDYLNGGTGNDTIEARDGVADTVVCGSGADIARVDGMDLVLGCESVTYAKPQTSAIKGPGQIKRSRVGSFTFSSNVPGSAFQCKIDKGKWKSCSSPFKVAGSSLTTGAHTLRVRAGYPAGNWDATPSKKAFKVVP